MGMAKVSVTIDEELLVQARALALDGNLSKLVGEALEQHVRFARMRDWLQEQEAEFGSLPDDGYAEHVRRQWPE